MKKILLAVISIIAVLIVGAVIFINSFNKKPLPDYNQNLSLKNLSAEVEVYRDEDAIPTIVAQNEEDLYRAAGYIVASDRLWQMDLIRRATQGRLSEIFGADLFKTDLMLRSLQINAKSDMIYEELTDEQKKVLAAYADGVNQFINQNENKLPIEFKILGYKPDEWTAQNSLNIIGYIAWDLVTAWGNEITLYKIQQVTDSATFRQFIPNFDSSMTIYDLVSSDSTDVSNPISTMGQTISNLGIVPFMASNNWVVNGQKSATGSPILCNDMHLGFGIPGIWYQMHFVVDGKINVTGLSIPGAPGIVAGHNDSIAWGMTNVMLDGSDFYIETLNDDSTKYLLNGEWKDLRIDTEKIITKDGDTLNGTIKYTHRGAIVSDFKHTNKAISMHWIGNEFSNEFAGIYKLNRASNWQEFRDACKNFGAVSQNIVYADVNGNIGLQLTGTVPIRKVPGYVLLPGDTTKYDWSGFVDFDSLPRVYNPDCGYIASANNKSSNNVDFYITQYYFQDFRCRRIVQMLTAKDKLSVEDMKDIQTDQNSALAQDILQDEIFEISGLNLDDPLYQKSLEILTQWDGNMTAEGVAPLIFEQFNILFIKNAVEDEITADIYKDFDNSKVLLNNILLKLFKDKSSPLFDNVNTPNKVENITDIVKLSYQETLDTLRNQLGDNINSWEFQRLHTLTLSHPLSKVKILDKVFKLNRGPYGVGGSNHTVSPYSYSFAGNFKVIHGASHRHIFTVDNWENSQTIIPTGESGIPASPFYCNQTERYLLGIYHNDFFSVDNVKNNAKFKMTFKPE